MRRRRSKKGKGPIEAKVEIGTPADAVWQALSRSEELVRWFSPFAEVKPGEGGEFRLAWSAGADWVLKVETWEVGRHLRLIAEAPGASGTPLRQVLDFHIETKAGKTVVRLVHAGFGAAEDWDEMYDGLESGWQYFLLNLRHCLEVHPGTPRRLISTRPAWSGAPDVAWRATISGLGVTLGDAPLESGSQVDLNFVGPAVSALVLMARRDRCVAFRIDNWNGALLFVEIEQGPSQVSHVGVWLSAYGLDAARCDRLQAVVDDLGRRLARSSRPEVAER